MAFTIDSDVITPGETGHIKYHEDISDVLNALAGGTLGGAINVRNTAYGGGAKGNGVTDDTAAIQAALNAAGVGQVVYAPAGTYVTSSPLVVPNGVTFLGPNRAQQSAGSAYPVQGAVIVPSASFTAGGLPQAAAVIAFGSSAVGLPGGTPTVSTYVRIINIGTVNTNNVANCDGICLYSNISASSVIGCFSWKYSNNFSLYTDSGGTPTGLYYENCISGNVSGIGYLMGGPYGAPTAGPSDTTWINCHHQGAADGNGAWYIVGNNNRLFGCRGDDSNGPGFTWVGQGGSAGGGANTGYSDSIAFTGCGTQNNAKQGLLILDGYTGVSTPAVGNVIVNGCSFDMDGRTGGSGTNYAGIEVNGYNVATITNTAVMVDTNSNASGCPQYGIATSASASGSRVPIAVRMLSGWLSGTTAQLNDAAPASDIYIDPSVITYTGQHSSHITTAGHVPNPLNLLQAASGTLAETVPRFSVSADGIAMSSGTLYIHSVALTAGTRVSNVTTATGNTAVTGLSHGWCVLLDSTRHVLAVTADQTSVTWTSTGTTYTLAFGAAYTVPVTGTYYVGVMIDGGNSPTLASAPALMAGINGVGPAMGATSSTGQTTPPTLGTQMAGITPNALITFWAYLT